MSTTRGRVPKHTRDEINLRILREIERNVAFYGEHKDKLLRD